MKKTLLSVFTIASFAFCACESSPKSETSSVAEDETQIAEEVQHTPAIDISEGKKVFTQHCATCHQGSGEGIQGAFPPLKSSDFLKNAEKAVIFNIIQNGSVDADGNPVPITVNGTKYSGGGMSVNKLTDKEVADVTNYILNNWGNNYGTVDVEDVVAE